MVINDYRSIMTREMAQQHIPSFPRTASRLRGRRERHKADLRMRLFRSGLKLFAARGFAATTVEDITQAADVAKGTFFNYFPTKEHLLMEFGEMRLDILRNARSQALEGRKSLREILHRMFHTIAQEPGESRAMARSMLIGGLQGETCSKLLRKNLAKGRHILCDMIAIGQDRGEIRRDLSRDDAARLSQQLVFGGLHLWTLDPHLDLKNYLDKTFDFFWASLGKEKGVGSRKEFSGKKPL
jgi:TetR/AcrR family transcriptional regulator, cholesterol catabolism regulator